MDQRFVVTAPLRDGVADSLADVPLLTMVWRAQRSEHRLRLAERRSAEGGAKALGDFVLSIADEIWRLRRAINEQTPALTAVVERLEAALTQFGVEIIAPEHEPYVGELMEIFHNIAQQALPDVQTPYVLEVVVPAVTQNGTLFRMGKAVIAIPIEKSLEGSIEE